MPGEPVVLDNFGGIVATARPEDLPEGASPRCNDVDFVVGRVIQRPGLKSVYQNSATQFGPLGGSSATDINTEGAPWSNPSNILANDGSFTTNTLGTNVGVGAVNVVPGVPISGSVMATATASRTFNVSSGGTATTTDTTGEITADPGPSNWRPSAGMGWSNFVMPTLPAGAVITSIVPTITVNASIIQSTFIDDLEIGFPPFPNLPAVFSGTYVGASLGTSPSAVTSYNPSCEFLNSIPFPPPASDFFNVSFIGLQINYTVPTTGVTGGYYALSETPTVAFSATTGSGATATITTTQVGSGPGAYKYVSGVTVTAPGSYTGTIIATFSGAANPANNATGVVVPISVGAQSDTLLVEGFGFSIPANYTIKGITVNTKGFSSSATLSVQMVKAGVAVGTVHTFPLPTSNAFVPLGGSSELWGTTWLYTDTNASNFGVELWVNGTASVSLDYVEITIFGTVTPANFNGISTANLNSTDQVTIALDSNGLSWEEDVTNTPGILALEPLIPDVEPGAYLKGVDANGVAYMAYSDLTQGVSQPMQFNGRWCDRITQVGPGQAPVFTPQQSTSDTFSITQITQPPPAQDQFGNHFYGGIYFLQSTGPGSTAPGNVVTIYYGDVNAGSPLATNLVNALATGFPVYIYMSVTGTPVTFGPLTVQVTSVGQASPPGQPRQFYYFTFVVNNSASVYYQGSGHPGYEVAWNRTLATLQAAAPIPGLTVGNQVTITGNSQIGYNATWTITQTLDSGAFSISSTSVTSGVATYNYTLQTGVAPAVGELVTITNTENANGALNVVNATIVTASGGSTGNFTVNVPVATDYASVPESGQGTTAGTLFAFDPGFPVLGTGTNPIFGTGTGGTLTFTGAAGISITAGTKQGSVFFITRNGSVTRPAPPTTFTVPSNCGAILCTHVPVGPPNVVARGITFTESGQNGVAGANFYYYDNPQTFIVNGVSLTSQALIIPDNTSTTASFAFSDSVLLASNEIDIPGNDYFNLIELGNPAWMFQYADRMLYGLCQSKIQNLLNMSFDGGYQPTYSSTLLPMPAGWNATGNGNQGIYTITAFSITSNVVTITAANSLLPGLLVLINGLTTGTYLNGQTLQVLTANSTSFTAAFTHANVSLTSDSGTVNTATSSIGLVPSLDFGNAFDMINYGASVWTNANVLFQPAYQDYLGVNIIQPNTPYSVRVKARALGADGQQVTIQLPTYANQIFGPNLYGSATFTFNQGKYVIQTAPLITGNGLTTVPSTLQISLGIFSAAIGAGIEVDRIEVFPTNHPIDTTTIWTSYADKFESVDIVSGQLGVGADNPQPATGAFQLLEQLYIEKTKSLQVTQDSPNYEPNEWQVRQASDRAGAVGPNAFDEGEEFTLSASRNGIYYFDGGKPMPISRELQSTANQLNLWEYVNWAAGSTIWIRNDLTNRRLLIGLPLNAPNPWLPLASAVTPDSPNVILMLNYTGCPTGEEMANSSEVHITMFGDLKALDMRRKWTLWQIPSPIAEFVPRTDTFSDPLFLCNGTGTAKIYQLIPGAADGTGQNTDDGAAINWAYTTYGFTKAKQGQQSALGALRKVWYYLAATMEGAGQIACKLYSNSLGALARNTFTVPLPFTLTSPQQNDQERVLEIGGQRVFVEFSSIGTGGYAEVGHLILDGEMDKVSPHRGVSS